MTKKTEPEGVGTRSQFRTGSFRFEMKVAEHWSHSSARTRWVTERIASGAQTHRNDTKSKPTKTQVRVRVL
jgi:hypothetical protein